MKFVKMFAELALIGAYGFAAYHVIPREFEIGIAYSVCCAAYTTKFVCQLVSESKGGKM